MQHKDDDQLMTAYLLGLLPQEQRELIDARLAADGPYFERLEAFEDDLILRWHRGQLPEAQRGQFDRAYADESRQARIAESLRFLQPLSARAAGGKAAVWVRQTHVWIVASDPIPRWAVACSFILIGVLAVSLSRPRLPKADGLTLAVALTAVGERGGQPARSFDVVRLSSDVATIQFQMSAAGPIVEAELVVAISANDRDVVREYTAPSVRWVHADQTLTITVPASDLPNGDYVLTVRRRSASDTDVLQRRAVRVTRTGS